MNKIIEDLRADLISNYDEKTKISGERFFREEVKLYGVKSAITTRIARTHYNSMSDHSKEYVFSLCGELWKTGIMEESFVACNWSYFVHKQYNKEDFRVFERWVNNYISNWAACDTLCNHTVGTLVRMFPACLDGLKRWATSQNRWVKRASAVSLIVPARKGLFLDDVFEIADILLHDKDDMVQKGYGWMLKVASQSHPEKVFEYVIRNKSTMPRTSLRYAIEKMPAELKKEAMKR